MLALYAELNRDDPVPDPVVAEPAWAAGCYKAMLMTGSQPPETLRFYAGIGFEQSKTGFQMRKPA